MSSLKFKKNLLLTLFFTALILIAANIFFKGDLAFFNSNKNVVNLEEINKRFKNILDDFAVEEKLIKEILQTDKHSGRRISNFRIQVPKDLVIPEILQEVFNTFRKDSLTIKSFEIVKGNKTILELKQGNSLVLRSEFEYSKNYSRNKGYISFIIYDVDPSNQTTTLLIESPVRLNFLIRPESQNLQYLEYIRNNSQQFSVLIDDDIIEQKYKLGPSYSEKRVVTVIKSLVTDYRNAVCFIIDENSDFYKSANYEILKREFSKRNIKLFRTTDFVNLEFDEKSQTQFANELNTLGSGESIIFLLSQDTYLGLDSVIKKYKKKGYRVVTSSLLL